MSKTACRTRKTPPWRVASRSLARVVTRAFSSDWGAEAARLLVLAARQNILEGKVHGGGPPPSTGEPPVLPGTERSHGDRRFDRRMRIAILWRNTRRLPSRSLGEGWSCPKYGRRRRGALHKADDQTGLTGFTGLKEPVSTNPDPANPILSGLAEEVLSHGLTQIGHRFQKAFRSVKIRVEIRSAPASLSATRRGFAFYVAHPIRSIHLWLKS